MAAAALAASSASLDHGVVWNREPGLPQQAIGQILVVSAIADGERWRRLEVTTPHDTPLIAPSTELHHDDRAVMTRTLPGAATGMPRRSAAATMVPVFQS